MLEELEFWRIQVERAEQRDDDQVLPRLKDALKLVEFKLHRYRGEERPAIRSTVLPS